MSTEPEPFSHPATGVYLDEVYCLPPDLDQWRALLDTLPEFTTTLWWKPVDAPTDAT